MNVKLGLVILLGLTAVSFSQSTTTSDKRTPLDTFKAAGYYVDLYGVELENAKSAFHPESMTVEELTEMGNFLDNKTTTIRQHLDTIHWEKLRTRFESGLWNRGSDAAYSLGSLMANYRTLNKQVQAWLKRKQFKEPVHGEIPHFLHSSYQTDTTTTTVKPTLRIQVPLSSMLRMPQYAHNETVILWGQLAADFDKNRNDKVKVEEIAVRALNETSKVMDRAEELRARLAGMNQTWVEYKQTKMDEQFLSAMARRIYTRHEDAVMRGHKLKEGWRQVMPSTTTVSLVSTTVSTTSTTPKPQQPRTVQILDTRTDETIRRGIANGGEIFQTYPLGG